jgi:hypothetical protein
MKNNRREFLKAAAMSGLGQRGPAHLSALSRIEGAAWETDTRCHPRYQRMAR